MTEYRNDTFNERLEDDYAQDLAILTGRIDIAGRVAAADLENLPRTDYVEIVTEYGNPEQGFVVAIVPGDVPPLSTESVAREMRALVEALPDRQFEGVLRQQAPARHGGALSRIDTHGRTVRF